jgi:hypothetical protein
VALKPGENPRASLGRHAERGPKRFTVEYTYGDLSRLLEMSEGSVRLAVHRGKLDPTQLDSLFEFVRMRQKVLEESSSLRKLVAKARRLVRE